MKLNLRALWRDWIIFGLRWLLLLFVMLIVLIQQSILVPPPPIDAVFNQYLIALIVGVVATLLYGVLLLIPGLQGMAGVLLVVGDGLIAGTFAYFSQGDPLVIIATAGALIVMGMLRLGSTWGSAQTLAVMVATAVGIIIRIIDQVGTNELPNVIPLYTGPFLLLLLLALAVGTWVYFQEDNLEREIRQIKRQVEEDKSEVEGMQRRARAIAQMADTLNATLDFNRVLDAALSIGDSLRKRTSQRIVSMVMLFESGGNALYVATARGIRSTDEERTIPGRAGIVGRALTEMIPIIGRDAATDPELNTYTSLGSIRSVICIPLRAQFETYGVLIYGSEVPEAFKDEHMETLQAIGTQATVALHNAQLYSNLLAERDKIIQLEEDGRKELARDLHDSPAQTIAIVKMRLELIQRLLERNPSAVPGELKEVIDIADQANQQIRHVLSNLYPLALESQGLIGALNQFGDDMMNKYNQKVEMRLSPELESFFSKHQQGVIYSIITEAVNNASKYAEASLVRAHAIRQGTDMVITITDNGKGFDVDNALKSARYGLKNLMRRPESLGGIMNIESQIGRGTRITIVLPIHNTNARRPERMNQNMLTSMRR